mgnify:CR=1 FL=1
MLSVFNELHFRIKFPEVANDARGKLSKDENQNAFTEDFRENMMRQIEFATFQPEKSFPIGRIYGPVSPGKTLVVRNPLLKTLYLFVNDYKCLLEFQTCPPAANK